MAFCARTWCRIGRKVGFGVKDAGVGGMDVVVPRESLGLGGTVFRRERIVWGEFGGRKVLI
jgi:hypothetical protein